MAPDDTRLIPDTPPAARPGSQWAVFAGLVVCLVVTGLLSSGRLVAIAEKREAKPAEPAPVATAPEER